MAEFSRHRCEVLVGTSGYGYIEWVGPVYPEDAHPDDFLTRYASMLSTVELNFSRYRMPTAERMSRLLEQAGPSLVFSVKANEALTHEIDPAGWRDATRVFLDALGPILKAGRLGAVLLQFPFSFRYQVDSRRYLDSVLGELGSLPVAVAFQNHEWYNNRVLDAFRVRRVSIATLDLPALEGLPPVMDVVAAPLAYIRFHGRNGETWWGSDSASRYDYLYSEDELEAWTGRVRAIAQRADRVLIYFNNYRRGQSVRNAKSLSAILNRAGALA